MFIGLRFVVAVSVKGYQTMLLHIVFNVDSINNPLSDQFCAIYARTMHNLKQSSFYEDMTAVYNLYNVNEIDAHSLDDTLLQFVDREIKHGYSSLEFHCVQDFTERAKRFTKNDIVVFADPSTVMILPMQQQQTISHLIKHNSLKVIFSTESDTHGLLLPNCLDKILISRINELIINHICIPNTI